MSGERERGRIAPQNEPEESLLRYLEFNARFYRENFPDHPDLYQWLLDHGTFFTPQRKPGRYPYRQLKQCFRNTDYLIHDYDGLRYCEGFAAGLLPVHHAWAVDENGLVVDITWRTTGKSEFRHDVDGLAYYGIAVTTTEVDNSLRKHQEYGWVLPDAVTEDWRAANEATVAS